MKQNKNTVMIPESAPVEAEAPEAVVEELSETELEAIAGGSLTFNHNQSAIVPESAPVEAQASEAASGEEVSEAELRTVAGGCATGEHLTANHNQNSVTD